MLGILDVDVVGTVERGEVGYHRDAERGVSRNGHDSVSLGDVAVLGDFESLDRDVPSVLETGGVLVHVVVDSGDELLEGILSLSGSELVQSELVRVTSVVFPYDGEVRCIGSALVHEVLAAPVDVIDEPVVEDLLGGDMAVDEREVLCVVFIVQSVYVGLD